MKHGNTFKSAKRRKELLRQKKQEEKRKRRLDRKTDVKPDGVNLAGEPTELS